MSFWHCLLQRTYIDAFKSFDIWFCIDRKFFVRARLHKVLREAIFAPDYAAIGVGKAFLSIGKKIAVSLSEFLIKYFLNSYYK